MIWSKYMIPQFVKFCLVVAVLWGTFVLGGPSPVFAAPTAQETTTAKSAVVQRDANLRAGPGTSFAVVGSLKGGQTVQITGQNADGSWYQLAGGQWIAAFLVNTGAAQPAPAAQQPAAAQEPAAAPAAQPTAAPQEPAGVAQVIIQSVYYDGQVYRVESDEYAVIANVGTAAINLGGWRLNAGDNGQDFTFPSVDLAPGQKIHVYTDESHPETGGFSFGRGQAIWNNKGDCGALYDRSGAEVSSYCY